MRMWAFWRRVQYGTGFSLFWILVFSFVYFQYIYQAPTCYDNWQNGDERGVDCGGSCNKVCTADVIKPQISWSRSFQVTEGQYNAVAHIVNRNQNAGAPEVRYTFSLYDQQGLITERTGSTVLPPDSEYPVFEARIDTQGRVPTQTLFEIEPIDTWVKAEGGTEQFRLVERQLKNADAQPRLDATLYNNNLSDISEVEVVAIIFDANGNALTASRTFIDDFPGRSETDVVFTWPQPIAKTIRSCEIPTDVVLAVDLSGSMNNDQEDPPEPITSVLQAAKAFVQRMQNGDQASLVTFATEADIAVPLTTSLTEVATQVEALAIDPAEETGSTNTGEALTQATQELVSERHNAEARKVMVLLTDGLATAPDEEPEAYALEAAANAKQAGITVYSIGLGEQVNMDFVRSLASSPEQSYQAVSSASVDAIYKTITTDICEDGAAVIRVITKTDAGLSGI